MSLDDVKNAIRKRYKMSKRLSDKALLQWAKDAIKYHRENGLSIEEACRKSASEFESYGKATLQEQYEWGARKNASASIEFNLSMIEYIIQNETMLLSQK